MRNRIIKCMKDRGYAVFENDSKPYNLNIVGIRSTNIEVDKFNDWMHCFWKYNGVWNEIVMPCTTLAGLYYLEKPTNPKGCAILVEGQYKSTYKIDKHNSKYDALCQRLDEVDVYRDDDKDQEFDFIDQNIDTGYFGINIHRASTSEIDNIGKYSAGCQVIQNIDQFDVFMDICKKASDIFSNKFTYTLLKEGWL